MVPVSPPLDSSGLTIIRMFLPQPEVVTSVLLRLYKPRDSSNIGLSQIRLLGYTTFNSSSNLHGEDDEFSIDSRFVKDYIVHLSESTHTAGVCGIALVVNVCAFQV